MPGKIKGGGGGGSTTITCTIALVAAFFAVSWVSYTQRTALIEASAVHASLRAELERLSATLADPSRQLQAGDGVSPLAPPQLPKLHELGIPISDLEHLGLLFMRLKVSQLLLSQETLDAMDAESKAEYQKRRQERRYVTGQ